MSKLIQSSIMDSLQENLSILKKYCEANKIEHNLSPNYFLETFTVNEYSNPGSGYKAFEKASAIQSRLKDLICNYRLNESEIKEIELFDEFKNNFYARKIVTYKF